MTLSSGLVGEAVRFGFLLLGVRWRLRAGTAAGLGARLYAVYVETAKERPDRITPRDRDTLSRNMALAESLGATVVRVKAARTVDGLIEFARREGITHVLLGQTQRSRWDILLHGSVLERFLREVPDASVEVLGESQG